MFKVQRKTIKWNEMLVVTSFIILKSTSIRYIGSERSLCMQHWLILYIYIYFLEARFLSLAKAKKSITCVLCFIPIPMRAGKEPFVKIMIMVINSYLL